MIINYYFQNINLQFTKKKTIKKKEILELIVIKLGKTFDFNQVYFIIQKDELINSKFKKIKMNLKN